MSECCGVSWYEPSQKWQARIRVAARLIHLGDYEREADAHAVYQRVTALVESGETHPTTLRNCARFAASVAFARRSADALTNWRNK